MKKVFINKITGEVSSHPIRTSIHDLLRYGVFDFHGWRVLR